MRAEPLHASSPPSSSSTPFLSPPQGFPPPFLPARCPDLAQETYSPCEAYPHPPEILCWEKQHPQPSPAAGIHPEFTEAQIKLGREGEREKRAGKAGRCRSPVLFQRRGEEKPSPPFSVFAEPSLWSCSSGQGKPWQPRQLLRSKFTGFYGRLWAGQEQWGSFCRKQGWGGEGPSACSSFPLPATRSHRRASSCWCVSLTNSSPHQEAGRTRWHLSPGDRPAGTETE